jgi:hypothetical protein
MSVDDYSDTQIVIGWKDIKDTINQEGNLIGKIVGTNTI